MPSIRTYEIVVRDCDRDFVSLITDEYSVDWSKVLNGAGSFEMEFSRDACTVEGRRIRTGDYNNFNRVDIVSKTRDATGAVVPGIVVGGGPWLIDFVESSGGTITLRGTNTLGALDRRINPFESDTAEGTLLAGTPISDAMKAVMRSNYGPLAASYIGAPDPLRDASAHIIIDPDDGLGAVLLGDVQIANQSVLSILQKLSDLSFAQGTPLFFDMVSQQGPGLPYSVFSTFVGQRGTDRTLGTGPGAVVLSDVSNTIDADNYSLIFDWRGTTNRQFGGGSGRGGARDYVDAQEAGLAALVADCPLEIREDFISVSSDQLDQIQSDTDAALQSKLAEIQFEATILDSASYTYGNNYGIGDAVTAVVEGIQIPVFVDEETGNLEDGQETLDIHVSNSLKAIKSKSVDALMNEIRTLRRTVNRLQTLEIPP